MVEGALDDLEVFDVFVFSLCRGGEGKFAVPSQMSLQMFQMSPASLKHKVKVFLCYPIFYQENSLR